jgi:hypothetical protein
MKVQVSSKDCKGRIKDAISKKMFLRNQSKLEINGKKY